METGALAILASSAFGIVGCKFRRLKGVIFVPDLWQVTSWCSFLTKLRTQTVPNSLSVTPV